MCNVVRIRPRYKLYTNDVTHNYRLPYDSAGRCFPEVGRGIRAGGGGGRAGVVFRPKFNAHSSRERRIVCSHGHDVSPTPRLRAVIVLFHSIIIIFFSRRIPNEAPRRILNRLCTHRPPIPMHTLYRVVRVQHSIDFRQVTPVSYPFLPRTPKSNVDIDFPHGNRYFQFRLRPSVVHTHTHTVERRLSGLIIVKGGP